MPVPNKIKPSHEVWVVWTKLGPAGVRTDKAEAAEIKAALELSGHVATVRKYTAGRVNGN